MGQRSRGREWVISGSTSAASPSGQQIIYHVPSLTEIYLHFRSIAFVRVMKHPAFLRNLPGDQLACMNLSTHPFKSPVVLSRCVLRWFSIIPRFLHLFHPLQGSIREQCPNAPVRVTVWVRGAEDHGTSYFFEKRTRVSVSCRVWQVIST